MWLKDVDVVMVVPAMESPRIHVDKDALQRTSEMLGVSHTHTHTHTPHSVLVVLIN